MKARAKQKELARERVEILLDAALATVGNDAALAKRQAEIARRICLKFNIRLPYLQRQLFCHGCKSLIIPGQSGRVRLSRRRRGITITCLNCGSVYRKIIEPKKAVSEMVGDKPKYA